jgi:hypothetical protein
MNKMTYFKNPEKNIFRERMEQYVFFFKSLIGTLKLQGFKLVNINKEDCDPTLITKCYKLEFRHEETNEMANIFVPMVDNNLAFVVNGCRWIPIFQVTDIPMYVERKEPPHYIFYNPYVTYKITTGIPEYCGRLKIGLTFIPLLYIMFQIFNDDEAVLNELEYKYEIVEMIDEEDHDRIAYIPIHNSRYLKIPFTGIKIKDELLYPFIKKYYNEIMFSKLESIIDTTDLFETICEKLTNNNTKIKQIIEFGKLMDYPTISNGIFSHPCKLIDLIIYYYKKGFPMEYRDINNLEKRRVRLGEYLMQKLSQHHKINIIQELNPKKNVYKKPYSNIIMDMLAVDTRRQIDDCLNPLSELCVMTKLTYGGYGGVNKETCNPRTRNLDDTHWGRVDPIDTPNGEAVGITLHIVPETVIPYGIITPIEEFEEADETIEH